jgi:hypothetical protein
MMVYKPCWLIAGHIVGSSIALKKMTPEFVFSPRHKALSACFHSDKKRIKSVDTSGTCP